jgi:hypothetical protein
LWHSPRKIAAFPRVGHEAARAFLLEALPASVTSKHLLHFEGGDALSAFRAQALLSRLQELQPRISGI